MRPAQPHDKAPALSGLHRIARGVPAQQDPARNGDVGFVCFDIEFEAHASVEADRQARNDAGHRDVAAFVRERQRVGHAKLCPHPGIGKSGQHRAGASEQPQR